MRKQAAQKLESLARILLRTASMSERPGRYALRVRALDWTAGRLRNLADFLAAPPDDIAYEDEWHA